MPTMTKTLRLDIDLLDCINTMKGIYKEKLGFEFSLNSLLTGMVVKGFDHYFEMLAIMSNGSGSKQDKNGNKIPIENFEKELVDLMKAFENYKEKETEEN